MSQTYKNNKSRSRSPITKVDKFGRTRPCSRSHSSSSSSSRDSSYSDSNSRGSSHSKRNRGNQRNLSRGHKDSKGGRSRKFTKERHSGKKRDGSSSSSSSSSSRTSDSDGTRIVASTKPKYLNARVFVANIIAKEVTKEELIKQFEKYGIVIDVLVHSKNYAFIQYSKEEHAKLAVEGEHGSTLKGWRLDVKMANENRRGVVSSVKTTGRFEGGRGRSSGHFSNSERMRSPPPGGRMWSQFTDPFFGGRSRPPPSVPYPPIVGMRDPFFMDPFRHDFPDPWLGDDPYRRSLYAGPYRDMHRHAPHPPPPSLSPPLPVVIECEIFVTSAQLRSYGLAVEQRVKEHNIITAVSVMTEGRSATQLVEELTAQSGLFAIFINPQNEMHRSLTLNILHGVPQEHRNMPLDDAISLVGRSFLKYVEGLREKAQAAATPLPSSSPASNSRVFLPPSKEVSYLLNLLADNRALTVAELNTVMVYLAERRDKLIDAESRPLVTEVSSESFRKSPKLQHEDSQEPVKKEKTAAKITEPASLPEDLTSKILSLFGNAGGKVTGVPPADQVSEPQFPTGAPAPSTRSQTSAPTTASLINFDNPNVQKALDSLIHNTPSFLKNISTKASSAQSDASNVVSSAGTVGSSGSYGQSGEMAAEYHSQGHLMNNQNLGIIQESLGLVGQMTPHTGQGSSGMPPSMGHISTGIPSLMGHVSTGIPSSLMGYNVADGQHIMGPMGRVYGQTEY